MQLSAFTHPSSPGPVPGFALDRSQNGSTDNGWLEEVPLTYAGGVVLSRDKQTWSHLSATVDDVEAADSLDFIIETGGTRISILLEEIGGKLLMRESANSSISPISPRGGPISILPAGFGASGHSKRTRLLRHLVIDIDQVEFTRITDESASSFNPLEPKVGFEDQAIISICSLIAAECHAPGHSELLYADSLASAFMVAVARVGLGDGGAELARGGLSLGQLRRAQEYMLENVAQAVSLRTLADLLGLSPAHFCRSFKTSTGKAPHQWLIEARVERAKSQLRENSTSIADIALRLGFCDQAHFTRTFGKVVGTTPMAWQKG